MQCVSCGFENVPGLRQCARCRSSIDLAGVAVAPPRARRGRLGTRWRRVWNRLQPDVKRWLQAIPRWRPATLALYHVPWEAVAWSIVPGLGHIRYANKRTGWLLLTGWLVLLLATLLTRGLDESWWFLAGAIFVHAGAMLSFMGPLLSERGLLGRAAVGALIFLGLGLGVYRSVGRLAGQFYGTLPVTGLYASPVLQNDDVLLYEGPWRRPALFQRGDLVAYRIAAARSHGAIVIGEGFGLDRVVGVPGDQVQVKAGQLLVNGQPPPESEAPLRDLHGPPDLDFQVGPDQYAVLPSMLPMQLPQLRDAPGVLSELTRVGRGNVLGRVVWRLHPWSRAGRVR